MFLIRSPRLKGLGFCRGLGEGAGDSSPGWAGTMIPGSTPPLLAVCKAYALPFHMLLLGMQLMYQEPAESKSRPLARGQLAWPWALARWIQ